MTKSLLAVVLLACSHPAPPAKPANEAPAAATCAAVGDHLTSILKASKEAPQEDIDRIGAIIVKHCTNEVWSEDARGCLVKATMETVENCESLLTQAQQAAINDDNPGGGGGGGATGGAPPPTEAAKPQPAMAPPPAPPPPASPAPGTKRAPSKSRSSDPCEGGQ